MARYLNYPSIRFIVILQENTLIYHECQYIGTIIQAQVEVVNLVGLLIYMISIPWCPEHKYEGSLSRTWMKYSTIKIGVNLTFVMVVLFMCRTLLLFLFNVVARRVHGCLWLVNTRRFVQAYTEKIELFNLY